MIDKLLNKKRGISLEEDVFFGEPFKESKTHILAINSRSEVALLLKSENPNTQQYVGFNGKTLRILFNRNSTVNIDGNKIKETFTIIHLKSEERGIQNYFVDICEILISNLGENPEIINVYNEIEKLKTIFLNLQKPRIKEEVGLWGELFLIYIQRNKSKALAAWHLNAKDRIDFNDGNIKLEIKTTLSIDRKHTFKLNQLRSHYKEKVIVCSIQTNEIENGLTIKDLVKQIEKKLNYEDRIKLAEKISSVLGNEIINFSYRGFDIKTAKTSISVFDSLEIPSLLHKNIPNEISNVSFTSDLTKAPPINLDITNLFV